MKNHLNIFLIGYFGVIKLVPLEIYCVDGLIMPYVLLSKKKIEHSYFKILVNIFTLNLNQNVTFKFL